MAIAAWPQETVTYSGQALRMGTVLPWASGAGNGVGARSAVRQAGSGTELRVQAQASPNMTVQVGTGCAIIQGAASNLQGPYVYTLDAITNLTIGAAHASLTRVDRIVIRIRDSTYDTSGAIDSTLMVIAGTPGAGAPAIPSNATYYTLALVTIVANDTAINSGDISDQRAFFAATGGTIACTSSTRPSNVPVGQQIYESDTDTFGWWNGSAFVPNAAQLIELQTLGSSAASVTFSNIPAYFTALRVQILARSTASVIFEQVNMRCNGDTGANYHSLGFWANQTMGAGGNVVYGLATGATSANIGDIYGASAGISTVTGGIAIEIPHYTQTVFNKPMTSQFAAVSGTNFSGGSRHAGWQSTAAITSITLFANSGNFATGSRFSLVGIA